MTGLLSRLSSRRHPGRARGFSLVELLLVLALIGIISAIAIPSYLGQRRRARVIGDAIANAKVLSMALESRKAENGIYGAVSTTYTWTNGTPSDATFLPGFTPKGNSQMNYSVGVGATGLTYILTVTDPNQPGAPAYQTDQSGQELARMQ